MSTQSSWRIYSRLFRFLRPYRGTFIIALLAMVIYGASDGLIPYLLKRILDDVFVARDEAKLMVLVGAVVVFAAFRAVFGFLQRYLSLKVGLRVTEDLRNEIGDRLLQLSPSFYSRHSAGTLLARMTNDTLLVRSALTDSAATLLRDSFRILGLLVAALWLDPVLGLIALVGMPLGFWPILRLGRVVRRYSKRGQDQFGGLTAVLHEIVLGYKVVQSFSMEAAEAERFRRENRISTDSLLRAGKFGAIAAPISEVLGSLVVALVVFYGGMSVIDGTRTQGDFLAFITAMLLLYEPIKKLGRLNATIQTGVAAAERVFEVLDTEPEIADCPGAVNLDVHKARIEFDEVSFRYPVESAGAQVSPPENQTEQESGLCWALRDVSLVIEPGQTLALVGMSGGGKSTLTQLLLRFYDPTSGAIRIGGRDLRDVTVASLRRSISLVDQHTFLFNESVRTNIAYGRPEATQRRIEQAAHAAGAHEFIARLPEGYETPIGDLGMRLSGGERARIAIARALIKDAPILVLDEATASLDSESERVVQQALSKLMQGRTCIVIAHRLATVTGADRIAVIAGGRVVECGAHTELLANGGDYARLHALQFEPEARKVQAQFG